MTVLAIADALVGAVLMALAALFELLRHSDGINELTDDEAVVVVGLIAACFFIGGLLVLSSFILWSFPHG